MVDLHSDQASGQGATTQLGEERPAGASSSLPRDSAPSSPSCLEVSQHSCLDFVQPTRVGFQVLFSTSSAPNS